jgi:hypothetical protein
VLAALTEAHKELDAAKKIRALMGNPFGEPQGPVEKGFRLAGWRRCAEGQGETQFCALLEAAVLAEREECARICKDLGRGHGVAFAEFDCVEAIRARGQE